MKKRIDSTKLPGKTTVLAAVFAGTLLLTACGSREYLKDIKASDYVTLGNYIGLEASAAEPVVEDGMVEMYLSYYIMPQIPAQEVTGRAIEEGDTANIDFVGYLDGEAFEGGTGSNYDLTIGAHQFIDGFEEGLIGVNIGETVSLDLAFPDPYTINPDLSGAPVVFDVKVNSISRQELTDDFVQSLEIEGCSTVQDFKDYLYNAIYDSAVMNYEDTIETTLINTVMADSTFKEPPSDMVDRFYNSIVDILTGQADAQGMTLEAYMQYYYGLDKNTYEGQFRDEALKEAQQYIMYQAIADAEGLNPTDEQVQEEISHIVEAYSYESEEAYRESNDVELLKEQIMRSNVMEFLKENGKIEMTSTIVD